jgi:transposase
LNTRTGEVLGKTAQRHTSQEFVAFLADLVASQGLQHQIHVIVDNLSAHKTQRVKAFLADHPQVRLHFTPTYSSWLNQVELWFAKIERDLIARGIFTSVRDLARKLMRYIRHHNKPRNPLNGCIEMSQTESKPVPIYLLQSTRLPLSRLPIQTDWEVFAGPAEEDLEEISIPKAVRS